MMISFRFRMRRSRRRSTTAKHATRTENSNKRKYYALVTRSRRCALNVSYNL